MGFFKRKPEMNNAATQTECEFTCTHDKKKKRDVWWYFKQAKRILDVIKLVQSCYEMATEDILEIKLHLKRSRPIMHSNLPFKRQLMLAASAA